MPLQRFFRFLALLTVNWLIYLPETVLTTAAYLQYYQWRKCINCIYCILPFPVYYIIVCLHVIVYVTFAAVCLRLQ